jgi:hypothetical protein
MKILPRRGNRRCLSLREPEALVDLRWESASAPGLGKISEVTGPHPPDRLSHKNGRGGANVRFRTDLSIYIVLCSFLAIGLAFMDGSLASASQTVVVVLDDSGSMKQPMRDSGGAIRRIEAAKQALARVIDGLPQDTQLGIFLLNQRYRGSPWLVPLGPIDARPTANLLRQIRADGGTPLGASLKSAADALLAARQRQVYGQFRLLVVTDGEANDPDLLSSFLPDILSRGITLDVIGVDMQAEHSLASRAHSYRRADDPSSFAKALQEVFAETQSVDDLSKTDNDSQSTFEMLDGLPDDGTAKAILSAMAIPSNEEIHPTSMNRDRNNEALIKFLASLVFFFIFFLVVAFVVLLGKVRAKNKRRR